MTEIKFAEHLKNPIRAKGKKRILTCDGGGILGRCLYGEPIDHEVGSLIGTTEPTHPKLFTYLRYNPETTKEGLNRLALTNIDPKRVQTLDAVDAIPEIQAVGLAVAKKVQFNHFQEFVQKF